MKNISLVFLLSLTIFSVFKYVYSLREKYDLLSALGQVKEEAASLANEKQALVDELGKERELREQFSQENAVLKENLRVSGEKLAQMNADFAKARETIEQLNSNFALIKAENKALIERKERLSAQLSRVTQENDVLKTTMSSVIELKKAIRELKKQARKVTVAIKEKVKSVQKARALEGNRGYLLKDGKLTYPSRVIIEVSPAPLPVKE
ncbi:MAG TPA: hypothetical protein VMD04_04295 [Candidatus Margulisiibacteriota bacterium]|nr:hypothetical protein [Candidatus Margulisiibacteriota bacterium]